MSRWLLPLMVLLAGNVFGQVQNSARSEAAIRAVLQAQVQATTIQARRMSASILLIKALGGGWDEASLAKQ